MEDSSGSKRVYREYSHVTRAANQTGQCQIHLSVFGGKGPEQLPKTGPQMTLKMNSPVVTESLPFREGTLDSFEG